MRDYFTVVSLFGLFGLALLLDSNSVGIVALFWAALIALLAAGLCLPRPLPDWLATHPVQGVYLGGTIVLLVVLFQFSQSADNSFGLSWMLCIAIVLYLLMITASATQQEKAWVSVTVLIAATAVYSIWNFLVNDLRAAWPVGDPNNYASLLYLIWVPWLHRVFVGRPAKPARLGWGLAGTALMSVTLYTTESRAGVALMVMAFVIWLLLVAGKKLSARPVFAHLVTATGVFVGCLVALNNDEIVSGESDTIGGGLGVRLQLALAALKLYPEHPITGFGLNAFSALYAARRPVADQETAGRLVHNDYIQFLIEGGPLLFLVLIVLACFALRLLWSCARAEVGSEQFARTGFALAACLLLAHAAVNFVFYRFSLPMLLALVLALAHRPLGSYSVVRSGSSFVQFWRELPKKWLWGPLLGGWIAFAYLVVDVLTAGIIGGEDSVPFAQQLREDPNRVHQWARIAQTLNANRGLPLLADASLSAAKIQPGNTSDRALRARYSVAKFRESLQVDPWNTNSYMAFYQFLRQHPDVAQELPEWEQPVSLLLRAVALNRQFVPALDELLRVTQSRASEREKILLTLVAPWLELIARVNLPASERYLEQLRGLLPAQEITRFEVLLERLKQRKDLHQRRR